MPREFCKQAVKDIRYAMDTCNQDLYVRAAMELRLFWPMRNN